MHPHDTPIPDGLCQCGCGGATSVFRTTNRRRGEVRGEHARFLHGHYIRVHPHHKGGPRQDVATRFWAKVEHTETCWLWTAARYPNGYGLFGMWPRTVAAHRVAWELTHGPIPDGLFVCHHCDVRLCVRPDHLFLGTPQDNIDDMWRKGRGPAGARSGNHRHPERLPRGERHWMHQRPEAVARGEACHTAKLTAPLVLQARAWAAEGLGYTEIGRRLGVSDGAIRSIVRRKSWRHLP